ncbi:MULTISPECIES: L,D-transpeptidase family protein [Alphaproteobacteria]|uniref:L,D-TPase catalytic domain-containing protein n=2 Tax=Alphaproteobacteria TaxID=28211 RepID=A0A512HLT7_9HYPH|nr:MULTISPECIES: L,D-transpeptidase family protein [Alphaproteobacteria]GEO86401.1 hypothetical protein RNA01_33330 [Ciceribacter naphthalenivorans]GLR22279.1 hypothetical protein GCM10007920_20660 [Ciceribacter naphthalenivorans]GLT05135.1 hypothetical protein GCM10007926_20660 [Sphingomonas psychrolutea]
MLKSLAASLGLLSATVLAAPALAGGNAAYQIIVSKAEQSLVVYDGDQVVATSRVSTGKPGHTTPSGIFSILEKSRYHESNLYSSAPMPWMQRLTWSGIALHESNSVPRYPASHGCIRLPRSFAKQLYGMTERGVHVIITDNKVTPLPFEHATLFSPRVPQPEGQLLSDAELRPSTIDASLKSVEVAMADVLPKAGAQAKVVLEEQPPLRILITRRSQRETLIDAQALLGELGFDAGTPDGHIGKMTIAAVNGFKRWKGLSTRGDLITQGFLGALYKSAGRGEPPLGQILVRQKFKPLFEAPVGIADPQIALGTHFIEAVNVDRYGGKASWQALTLENHLSSATAKRLGITTQADDTTTYDAATALDRITIPDDVRHRIETLMSEGTSLTISDTGMGPETGAGTDFITITHSKPKA